MRLRSLSLALFTLALPTSAQVPCGLPGVTVTVSPQLAQPGTPITVTLTNGSNSLIQLPSSCTYSIVYAGQGCGSNPVFGPGCLAVITPIAPGQSHAMPWNQNDQNGVQVPDGEYSIEVRYWDANFTSLTSCCANVTIGGEPGTGYCFAGGAGVPCPCGNVAGLDAGCENSSQQGARLSGSGNASVGNDSAVLSVSQCPPNTPGLFFSGPASHPATMFGDGLRCVSGPVMRLGVIPTDAAGSAQTPWTLSVLEGLAPGDVREYQYWYRDPAGPCGGGFNLSNAYHVQW